MKKVNYEFVTGEVVEVEVSEEWAEVLAEMDRKEYNNEKKETRRHCTMDVLGDEGEWMLDCTAEPYEVLEKKEKEVIVANALNELTDKQRDAVLMIHIDGMTITAYAEQRGVSQQVAAKRLYAAGKKIKVFLENRV